MKSVVSLVAARVGQPIQAQNRGISYQTISLSLHWSVVSSLNAYCRIAFIVPEFRAVKFYKKR